jgi:hypothetical protein
MKALLFQLLIAGQSEKYPVEIKSQARKTASLQKTLMERWSVCATIVDFLVVMLVTNAKAIIIMGSVWHR